MIKSIIITIILLCIVLGTGYLVLEEVGRPFKICHEKEGLINYESFYFINCSAVNEVNVSLSMVM